MSSTPGPEEFERTTTPTLRDGTRPMKARYPPVPPLCHTILSVPGAQDDPVEADAPVPCIGACHLRVCHCLLKCSSLRMQVRAQKREHVVHVRSDGACAGERGDVPVRH